MLPCRSVERYENPEGQINDGFNCHVTCLQAVQAMIPGSQILAVWSKTDLQSVGKNLCLGSDAKKVKAKPSLNSLGITLMVLDN